MSWKMMILSARLPPALLVAKISLLIFAAISISNCGGGGGGGGGGTTYTLSGTVTNAFDETGIQGVDLSISGSGVGPTTTDITGSYNFSGLANGTYTLTPAMDGAVFIPNSLEIVIDGGDAIDADFLALRSTNLGHNIEFLPQTFRSNEQLRASLHVSEEHVIYTDSSDSPLKKQPLDGSPTIALADRFESAVNVILHGESIYWIEGGDLHRMGSDGAKVVLANGLRSADADVSNDIVVDSNYVYWVDQLPSQNCSPPCNWVIQKVPLDGGAIVNLATADRRISAIAIDANSVYWELDSLEPLDPGCNCGSRIFSVPKSGGSPILLVDGSLNGTMPPVPTGFTPGSWLPTGGIALSEGDLIFAVSGNSAYEIKSIPKNGGAIIDLATVTSPVSFARNATIDIAIAGETIVWLDTGNMEIKSLPLTGGEVTTMVGGLLNPNGLAINSTNAYWTEAGASNGCCLVMEGGSIKSVSLAGGAVATVIQNLDAPTAIDVDDTNITWSEAWRVGNAQISDGIAATAMSGITDNMARITVSQSKVYILDGGYIKTVPLTGGKVEKITGIASASINDFSIQGMDITSDQDHIYWTTKEVIGAPVVRQLALAGGGAVVIADEGNIGNPQDCYWRISVVGQSVYWSEGSTVHPIGCAIKKVPVGGGSVSTIVDQPYMMDFTVDDENVYFSEASSSLGTIRKIPTLGGSSSEVARNVTAWVLANDPESLYWLDLQSGSPAGMEKTTGPSDWIAIPIDLSMAPLLAFDAVLLDQSGFYFTETQTGSIYRIY